MAIPHNSKYHHVISEDLVYPSLLYYIMIVQCKLILLTIYQQIST